MRRIAIISSITVLFYSVVFGQSSREFITREIIWHDSIELRVSDFLSDIPLEDERSISNDKDIRAMASCKIDVILEEENEKIGAIVYPIFDMKRSWIDTTDMEYDRINELLSHEMGHFDLAEYVARLIRKEVDSLIVIGCLNVGEYKRVIQDLNVVLKRLNNKYDEETLNGMVLFKQEEWDEKIRQKLASLAKYSTANCLLED